MDESHAKAQETRKRNEQARRERQLKREREKSAQVEALRQIRDNPKATPEARLEAVKLLLEMLAPYGIAEIARTGMVALQKGPEALRM